MGHDRSDFFLSAQTLDSKKKIEPAHERVIAKQTPAFGSRFVNVVVSRIGIDHHEVRLCLVSMHDMLRRSVIVVDSDVMNVLSIKIRILLTHVISELKRLIT